MYDNMIKVKTYNLVLRLRASPVALRMKTRERSGRRSYDNMIKVKTYNLVPQLRLSPANPSAS